MVVSRRVDFVAGSWWWGVVVGVVERVVAVVMEIKGSDYYLGEGEKSRVLGLILWLREVEAVRMT